MSRWIRQWIPVLVWAVIIWTLSTRYFSAADTASWIKPLLRWLDPGISAQALNAAHYAIRKAAHFVEYYVFCLLLYRAVRGEERGWHLKWALIALVTAGCYAGLDEVHQALVVNRGASAMDAILDSSSAFAAMAICWLSTLLRTPAPAAQDATSTIPPRF